MRKLIDQPCHLITTLILGSSILLSSCEYDVRDLEPKPTASFSITPIAGQTNKYLLTSTSQHTFRYDWDKADGRGFKTGKSVDTAYFADKGTYTLKLFAFGHSGTDTASQTITVAQDDPAAQTPFKLLTGNSSRKWKLASEAGALWIGPDANTTWWQNGVGELTSRSCLFNDEYTFNKTGSTVAYDSKGDFYVDEEGGNPHPSGMPAVDCYANGDIPSQFQDWVKDGNFTFEVTGNKLKIIGKGAHLGLYKAGTPPDAALATPAASVTYDIVSITASRLVLKLDYGWGAWRFTYAAIN
ncbi:PKD domain-containing protein [Terrimonas pollutisoli]|uniref:PKD domain-containing protein n=1 Tax=Terrimonas pollutisoli TaxID=3034147 RepID=UPI0023EDCD54|nr:PKD domain-containing protein [Terrimonas sp. H1YJ31]